jgi:hypothetical protein
MKVIEKAVWSQLTKKKKKGCRERQSRMETTPRETPVTPFLAIDCCTVILAMPATPRYPS